jgi:hypothetical protein
VSRTRAGFLTLESFSRWPIATRLFIARDVVRAGEKPAPFTRTVKGAAHENLTLSKNLA